MAPTATR
jgi:NADPH:quinone reductase-like Zn-dependent oxidoreductase